MATLKIVFQGSDEVAGASKQVADDIRGVGTAADEAKSAGTGFFGGLLQTAGGFLAANVIGQIGGQVSSFISGAFDDARGAQQLMSQTEAVITSTGGAAGKSASEIADLASSLSDASGKSLFGDDQIQQSENLLLTFTNIKGAVFDAATAISVDMAQALGGEPKAQAIQLGKALNDPIAGISALTRVGVTFTDEQKNQIKAMQEAGDMAGAQKVILDELNKEFGGSAAAAAKATGGWSEFQGRLGEAGETMATAVLPILGQLGSLLLDKVMPVIEGAADAFSGLIEAFQDAGPLSSEFSEAIGYLAEQFGLNADAVEQVVSFIQSVVQSFQEGGDASTTFGGVLDDLATIWKQLQAVIAQVTEGVQQVVLAVFGQVQTFLHNHGDDIKGFLQSTWQQISEIIKLAIELIQSTIVPVLQFIADFIKSHGTEIQTILSAAWNGIKSAIDIALTLITGILKVALDLIHGNWSQAWEDIKAMSARIVEDIVSIVRNDLEILKTVFGGAIDWVKNAWQGLVDGASAWGQGIIDGITEGAREALGGLYDMISGAVDGAIGKAKDALNAGLHAIGVPGYASGVENAPGGLAIVGERGPELMVVPRGANIYPADDTRRMLGATGGGASYSFHFTVDARGSTMRPEEFRRIAEDVVAKAVKTSDIRTRMKG